LASTRNSSRRGEIPRLELEQYRSLKVAGQS
jgi:hypothetical protein